MRPDIKHLINQGRLPSSNSDIDKVQQWQDALEKVTPPVTDEEAAAIIGLFPAEDDECFGLAWTLVHLVETAPNWPLRDFLQDNDNVWIRRLRQAARLE